MKLSRRAKRMQRHHQRGKHNPGLNLVSLMDIFTILVFFLLVSSAEVQNLPSTASIKLPESVSRQPPRETVTILVSDKDIIVQGERIADTREVTIQDALIIEPLKQELEQIASRSVLGPTVDDQGQALEREVMILADRFVPFSLLKKIMATCTEAKYNTISLAVLKKTRVQG